VDDSNNSDTGVDPVHLQVVVENLPAGFEILRAEALADGHGFIEKLATDWMSHKTRFDREGESLLAALVNGELAGIAGITTEPIVPGALRMRRFYVRPVYRRDGIGRKLAMALLVGARRRGCSVTVNASKGSVPFWESLGFKRDSRDGHTHLLDAGGQ